MSLPIRHGLIDPSQCPVGLAQVDVDPRLIEFAREALPNGSRQAGRFLSNKIYLRNWLFGQQESAGDGRQGLSTEPRGLVQPE